MDIAIEHLHCEHDFAPGLLEQTLVDRPLHSMERRKEPFRIGPAARYVVRIAEKYYRGSYKWPNAMRKLLDHYRTTHDVNEAAKVAVLLAEAFPHDAKRQLVAAELLNQARRSEGEALARILSESLDRLTEHVVSMSAVREEVIAELQDNLRKKLDKLLQSPPFDEHLG